MDFGSVRKFRIAIACGVSLCACGVTFMYNLKIQVASYSTILRCLLSKDKKLRTLLTWDGELYGNVLIWAELTYTEIAERLNVAVSTVHSTCMQELRKYRECPII